MPAIETLDLSELPAALARLGAAPTDYRPLWKRVKVQLRAEALTCFDQQRSPDGAPWAPLAASTVKGRRKGKGKGTVKPLRDTGLLMLSVTANGTGHVEQESPLTFAFGSNLPRAWWQNFGTRTIPARPFVGISEEGADVIADMVGRFVVEDLTRRTLGR